MDLDALCAEYLKVRGTRSYSEASRGLSAAIRSQLPVATAGHWQWLAESLADDKRKWFAQFVVGVFGSVPKVLYEPMIRAAVYEVNPSTNREFVEPCLSTYGHRRVNTSLLNYLERGSDFEKAGAANALYWANVSAFFFLESERLDISEAKVKAKAVYDELADVWQRKRSSLLTEFVENSDVHVRRSIIPGLNLDPDKYQPELRPLVHEAIRIARAHPDDYIRHRVDVQLGTEALLRPLPHRDTPA